MDKEFINYMTPGSFKRLSDEMNHLLKVERPQTTKVIAWAAGNGDRSENADYIYGKKRLREIDSRLRFLRKRLHNSKVIDPLEMNSDQVQFSATVEVLDEDDQRKEFSIVGIDEVDPSRGKISWRSPLGKVLLGKSVGDFVTVKAPKGEYEVEIIKIEYKEIK
ncbi:transcription elongation factor GreB [Halobacteriovorax sp. HLS]|uniref:transcription elongation factor GreB n=1 Tax=Halobacteriovorax sp. HLS TaxID=2234000 RepID=UPI001F4EFA08|nr:transcription elongation factor GreB [Halobacteriovorax sp. HLS]